MPNPQYPQMPNPQYPQFPQMPNPQYPQMPNPQMPNPQYPQTPSPVEDDPMCMAERSCTCMRERPFVVGQTGQPDLRKVPYASEASVRSVKPWSRLSASHVAVCQQGICVEYSVECSQWRALNGILVSTVDN
eukprot:1195538-Prorocentrum_minimum.AAC.1